MSIASEAIASNTAQRVRVHVWELPPHQASRPTVGECGLSALAQITLAHVAAVGVSRDGGLADDDLVQVHLAVLCDFKDGRRRPLLRTGPDEVVAVDVGVFALVVELSNGEQVGMYPVSKSLGKESGHGACGLSLTWTL